MGLYPKALEPALLVPGGKYGNIYVLDPANGSDSNPGMSFKQPLATLEAAYAKCVANQNDVVLVVGGASGVTLSAPLVWAKNYTHLIGVCAPTQLAQRSRIFQLASLVGASPLIDITASGCIFKDLYIFQGVNDATSLINVRLSGGRNYFENVHFAGGGHAAMAINDAASLVLDGAEENTFVRCTVGVDTIAAATGLAGLLFDSEAHRNVFKECYFVMWAANTNAIFAEVVDATGIDRFNIFENCWFINTGTTLAEAFKIPAMTGPRRLILKDCVLLGATDWEASNRGILYLAMGTITGGGNSGFAVVAATA
jgi:hypothetical protein